jgi:hypothetical protein
MLILLVHRQEKGGTASMTRAWIALAIVVGNGALLAMSHHVAAQSPPILHLPLALGGNGIPPSTAAPSPVIPTPTPTHVFVPGPPTLVYSHCQVTQEHHVDGGATVTARWTRTYNRASRVTRTSGDFAGGLADGVVDRISVMTYRDDWMPVYGVVTDTLRNIALVHEWHLYDLEGRHVSVLRDEDGDRVVDSRTTYTYDAAGRIKTVLAPGRRTDYTYNGPTPTRIKAGSHA